MRWLGIGLVAVCVLLAGCSQVAPTGNVVSSGPIKDCTIDSFMCYPEVGSNTEIVLDLYSQLDFEVASGTVTLTTKDCALASPTVPLGAIPGDGETIVTFTCPGGIPPKLDGTITLQYVTLNGAATNVTGSIHYRAATD